MRRFLFAAVAVGAMLLAPARAGEGSMGFGRSAYAFGYAGSQYAYQLFLDIPNGYTQAGTAWGYYGQLYASYGVAAADPSKAQSHFTNAHNCFTQAQSALAVAVFTYGATINNHPDYKAAAANYAVAVPFALYARSGF